ncbi:nucleotide exchange factor GrpE [Erythrobacter sp. F6033]|uniref:nucleotide exchange factor GrpE n=1 Tax=Erythrobacter sp. F6033 TaxID=2926401 RepID=UPI001FF575EC|nr:nucleotide exchange factor GrpE [Erythrobacter sp. F6033]MCK0128388.1 nucleotide exchange factor GrpE [Erythrobacter sp. F6033]
MIDNDKPQDDAANEDVKAELKGVPEEFLTDSDETDEACADDANEALESLRRDLDEAKQEVLYAKADTQNVRRRAEKDIQDARNYAATGFARDVLSVWDNLSRAVDAIPESLREDEKMKGLVVGIEATQRELEKVFKQNGIERIAAMDMPLDPNQHQAMMEVPTDEKEPGTIVQEMQSGWMIKNRLLRPAMVGVAKKPD